ncbi:unnamed protein product [Aphis gossypii]|uniref:Uncharacterized protein n=1 Tax=Aphis gossypii TaxID=80765 RepID=A0A9P0JCL4_APHGO|nr:unnamed protein product [Aphis gossypii]
MYRCVPQLQPFVGGGLSGLRVRPARCGTIIISVFVFIRLCNIMFKTLSCFGSSCFQCHKVLSFSIVYCLVWLHTDTEKPYIEFFRVLRPLHVKVSYFIFVRCPVSLFVKLQFYVLFAVVPNHAVVIL